MDAARLDEEAIVAETAKRAEVAGAFDNYKRGTETEIERLISELETAQVAASGRISETELNDSKTSIRQLGIHIKDPDTAYCGMERRF